MKTPRVLILKAGITDDALLSAHGDYEQWFIDALHHRCAMQICRVCEGEPLPDAGDWDGVLITGSPLSIRDEAPWMLEMGRWSVQAARSGTPVFGICFGHQAIGEVLGGRIGLNPNGREVGAIDVTLTDAGRADPLFAGLPEVIRVQATHGDILVVPPVGGDVRLLGGNANTDWQAFAVGERLRAVQFHPEITAETMDTLLTSRGQTGVRERTPHGPRILNNWADHWL